GADHAGERRASRSDARRGSGRDPRALARARRTGARERQGAVAHVPAKHALGLDPRVDAGSPTRTCANEDPAWACPGCGQGVPKGTYASEPTESVFRRGGTCVRKEPAMYAPAHVKISKDFPIPDSMKAWVLGNPGELALTQKPVPVPRQAEVLVRIDA